MIELRKQSQRETYIADYLKIAGISQTEEIKFIDEGIMNFVYSVGTSKGVLFFKQALSEAKRKGKVGPEFASFPMQRTGYEIKVMEIVRDISEKIITPQVLEFDKENNVLVMSDVSEGGNLLQDRLLDGDFDENISGLVGKYLGAVHRETYDKGIIVRQSPAEDFENWDLMFSARTRNLSPEKIGLKTHRIISGLYDDAMKNHNYPVLMKLDHSPKNIIQRVDGKIGVLDFECSSAIGDPAFDIGFSLGHYLLIAAIKGFTESSKKAIKTQTDSYISEIEGLDFGDAQSRMGDYACATILYRIAGSSTAKYVPADRQKELIGRCSQVINKRCCEIEEIVETLSN